MHKPRAVPDTEKELLHIYVSETKLVSILFSKLVVEFQIAFQHTPGFMELSLLLL